MKYGLVIGTMDTYAQANQVLELTKLADQSGWHGAFFADHLMHTHRIPWLDPNIMMAAIATHTQSIRLGTWITAVPRRLPWQLARDLATLDQLSNGRMMLGVGLGAPPLDYTAFGREYNLKELASRLDESLDIIDLAWKGETFSYEGKHFQLEDVRLLPTPVQKRIPIYIGGYQPGGKKALQRGTRWDGIMPVSRNFPYPFSKEDLEEFVIQYKELGGKGEIIISGETFGTSDEAEFHDYAKNLGVTWILKHAYPPSGPFVKLMGSLEEQKAWIQAGPLSS